MPDGHGGSPERRGGARAVGVRALTWPGFDKATIDIDEDHEPMPEQEQEGTPEEGWSQLALASQCSNDPLSHYISDEG